MVKWSNGLFMMMMFMMALVVSDTLERSEETQKGPDQGKKTRPEKKFRVSFLPVFLRPSSISFHVPMTFQHNSLGSRAILAEMVAFPPYTGYLCSSAIPSLWSSG